jgi:hypothetical protein
MTITPELRGALDELGNVLQEATVADVGLGQGADGAPGRSRNRPRRRTLVVALAAAAVVVPGAALGASALISDSEVAGGLPAGTAVLIGTQPTCETVRAGVEYDCTLASAPSSGDVRAGEWQGTVEPIVDHGKRVDGGCRSLNADGTHWSCYIGQEAVRQGTVGPRYLGEPLPAPVRG